MGTDPDAAAVDWLLASEEPGIRYRARTELLAEDPRSPDLVALASTIADGPKASAQLRFGDSDVHPYEKWTGSFWRLGALVELGLPPCNEAADNALDALLDEWVADSSLTAPHRVDGLVREHAAVFGYPVGIACRLGHGRDPRVAQLAAALCDWQWPDGGWNCDDEAKGHRSSFHESLLPTWGLAEYHRITSEQRAADAVANATELFLGSRLFRRSNGSVIDPSFTQLHWPAYWHYDMLGALGVLAGIEGALADERIDDAFDLLEAKRRPDGTWRADGRWWRAPGSDPEERGPGGDRGAVEVVDWGTTADEMITFNALRARRVRSACQARP